MVEIEEAGWEDCRIERVRGFEAGAVQLVLQEGYEDIPTGIDRGKNY
jgi:hypothetical protein